MTLRGIVSMARNLSKVRYFDTILDVIGNTPLVRLHRVTGRAKGLILAKTEYVNPGGSSKDRIGSPSSKRLSAKAD
jgi:hypothetical protein